MENLISQISVLLLGFGSRIVLRTPINLNGTVSLLRELNRDDLADECIKHYIERRKSEPKLFHLDEYAFEGDITDASIRDAFAKATVDTEPALTLHDVVSRIAGKNGWGRNDIEVMYKASVDDFYELFKSAQGDCLRSYIKACLQFKRISNANDKEKAISTTAEEALKRIGKESDINKRRVSRYGIEVDAT